MTLFLFGFFLGGAIGVCGTAALCYHRWVDHE